MFPLTYGCRRLIKSLCLGFAVGMFSFSGCAVGGAAEGRGPVADTSRPEKRPAEPTILHVSEDTFERQVLRTDVPVLVDFYASWCGPCKKLTPILEQVAQENPQARVVKVNVDENLKLAERYNIKSLPSVLVFKGGRVVAKQQGVVAKKRLNAMLAL